jgi:hypothetical protein
MQLIDSGVYQRASMRAIVGSAYRAREAAG